MRKSQDRRRIAASSTIAYKSGRIYFSAALERKVFFLLTLAMLLYGILSKLGIV